nr:MAG TPA: hypothetical protein [Caudoviricetes sp.]
MILSLTINNRTCGNRHGYRNWHRFRYTKFQQKYISDALLLQL